jgi:hypothetical protein
LKPVTTTTGPPATTSSTVGTTWRLSEVRFLDELKNSQPYTVTKQPSGTGGQVALTVRGGGGLCDGKTEDVHFAWTFGTDVTTVRNGDAITMSLQGATDRKAPACDGALASKSFARVVTQPFNTGLTNDENQQRDSTRFGFEKGSQALAEPASSVSDSFKVDSAASNSAKPIALFSISLEGFGYEVKAVYIYRQV